MDLTGSLGQPSRSFPVFEVPPEDYATRCSSVAEWAGTGCQIHSEAMCPLAFEPAYGRTPPGRILGNIHPFHDFHPTHLTWTSYSDRVACIKPTTYPTD